MKSSYVALVALIVLTLAAAYYCHGQYQTFGISGVPGVEFVDFKWEYKGQLYKNVAVNLGDSVKPHVYVRVPQPGEVFLLMDLMKDVPGIDPIVRGSIAASGKATQPGQVIDVTTIGVLTMNEKGLFYMRVFNYEGNNEWKRIDPWKDSDPNAPKVAVGVPLPSPPQPEPTPPPAPQPSVEITNLAGVGVVGAMFLAAAYLLWRRFT